MRGHVGVTVVGWLVAAIVHGPVAAMSITGKVLRNTVLDLVRLSPRRAGRWPGWPIQESIRRRVVVVSPCSCDPAVRRLVSRPRSIDPARLYLDFVLTATSYLVLLLALFLSSLSLPADIKNRTMYTVVTKPVRASEVVLGRIVGFAAVGTLLLVVMGAISYVFVGARAGPYAPIDGRRSAAGRRRRGRAAGRARRAAPAASTAIATK